MSVGFRKFVKRTVENQLIDKWLGERIIHTSKSETSDDDGYTTAFTDTDTRIFGVIRPITEGDKIFDEVGHIAIGDAHGFFKIGDAVKTEDVVTSIKTGNRYEVQEELATGNVHGFETFLHFKLHFRENVFQKSS